MLSGKQRAAFPPLALAQGSHVTAQALVVLALAAGTGSNGADGSCSPLRNFPLGSVPGPPHRRVSPAARKNKEAALCVQEPVTTGQPSAAQPGAMLVASSLFALSTEEVHL